MSAQPLVDVLLWLRWLAAAVVVLWLPGHLLAGRWCRGLDATSRGAVSLGAGTLLLPSLGLLLGALHIPLRPVFYLPAAMAVALALGTWPAHRLAVAAWTHDIPPFSPRAQGFALTLAAAALVAHAVILADLPAPPHHYDSSNHAWMTRQVTLAETLWPADALRPAWGQLPRDYLLGLHAVAALVGRVSGVAPYISIWYLALVHCAGLGVMLSLLWRWWGASPSVVLMACAFVAFNQLVPSGVLQWGGFALLAGFFVCPLVVLMVRGAWNGGPAGGLFLGLALFSLGVIHASKLVVVALLLVASLAPSRTLRRDGDAVALLGSTAAVAAFLALGWLLFGYISESYLGVARALPTETVSAGRAIEAYLRSAGKSAFHQVVTVLGLFIALRGPGLRSVAVVSLILGLLYVLRVSVGDAVSRWFTLPFYGVGYRVLYLQIFLLPPLAAFAVAWVARRLASRWRNRRPPGDLLPDAALAGVLTLALCAAVAPGFGRNVANMRSTMPFSADDYQLARRMGRELPPSSQVVNAWGDGSSWAMHVSGLQFVLPFSWDLLDEQKRHLQRNVVALLEKPWTENALVLKNGGADYVFASDTRLVVAEEVFPRKRFDSDDRFELVLRGRDSSVYRILWEESR